jgi:DNA-binding winged helix-turn-helix (wHTH) protein
MNLKTEVCPERNGVTPEILLKSASFRDFKFDFASCELRRGGLVVHLRPRAARALALLIAHAGVIVPYEQLRAAIWGGTVVDWRSGLHQIMRDLRKAFDDRQDAEAVIESVNRRGYRFRPAVRPVRARQTGLPVNRRDLALLATGALLVPVLILFACILIAAESS